MRLICPNCSAQYEIDVTLIPDEGRDVQCSNCGHTWFELPPPAVDFEQAPDIDATLGDEDVADDLAGDDTNTEERDGEVGSEDHRSEDGPSAAAIAIAAATDEAGEAFDEAPAEFDAAPRRPADAADLDVLREEAERELSQRRAPPTTDPIETQTDLGLENIRDRQTPTRALRARMAHLGEDEPKEDTIEETDIGARPSGQAEVISDTDYQAPQRDLLPDIDEINSTLKSTRKRTEPSAATAAGSRGGFRTGFVLMMLLTALLILAYAQAPAIARAFPASETALLTYVDKANGVRDWIDGMIRGN